MTPAALGFRAHSGWAAMVAVSGPAPAPVVLDRCRVPLIEPGAPGAAQPYHFAAEMALKDAQRHLDRCAQTAREMACAALQTAVADLAKRGHRITGCAILLGSGRPAGDLAATLASHPAIHTAEGVFFRDALKAAAESCRLKVAGVTEKGLAAHDLYNRTADLGKLIGPPWTQDQKLAALAAWLLLAGEI